MSKMSRMSERYTHVEHEFGPVWNENSRILVLGSMPSPKSREDGFYYAHPRNRFWPVLERLFVNPAKPDDVPGSSVETRRDFVLRHHIALWDVIASCDIAGASDASIRNAVGNDPTPLLRGSEISMIFTTGAKAAQLYRRLCLPYLQQAGISIPMIALPSTSPANAAMNLDQLTKVYKAAILPALT